MKKEELKVVYGGGIFSFTSTFFNAISRYITTVKSLGESVGSSIRRILTRSSC